MPSDSSETSLPRRIHAYFCDEDADVIVRASDGVDFKMYRVILGKASPVFKSMFTLPQSPSVVDDRDFSDGLPVVEMAEDSHTLDILFRFCYPCERPELKSLDDVHLVLAAADKYDMEAVAIQARRIWRSIAALDPLRAFAIACKMRWGEEARFAARLSLREPIWPLEPPVAPEFKVISADTVIRLMSYHRKCGLTAMKAARDVQWTAKIFNASSCTHCLGDFTTVQTMRMRDWFTAYVKRAAPALETQPSGTTVTKRAIVDQSIREIYEGPPCEVEMHCIERIRQIVQVFGDELDKVISQVSYFSLHEELRMSDSLFLRSPWIWICEATVPSYFAAGSCHGPKSSFCVFMFCMLLGIALYIVVIAMLLFLQP